MNVTINAAQTASRDFFRKYMPLGRALDTLKQGMYLAHPEKWADGNDKVCAQRYTEIFKKSVRAICVTEGTEKYHHWRSYNEPGLMVALLLSKKAFIAQWDALASSGYQTRHAPVRYFPIRRATEIAPENFVFSKFNGYESEQEYRFVAMADRLEGLPQRLPLSSDAVKGIIVNPWADNDLVEAIRIAVNAISPFASASVTKSTVLGKDKWIAKINGISPKR